MYTVYKHTTPSGKVYVGITKLKPERRWKNGNGYKNNEHFYRAILKYGWENIKHEIVKDGLTKRQACNLEIELIAKYDSTNPDKGYNHSIGGECGTLGAHLSAETRQKLSESHKGKPSPRKGLHLSAETRQKLSESLKGQIPPCVKPLKVICVETGEVFQQSKDASKKYGIASANIRAVCRHKREKAGGYHWKYADGDGHDYGKHLSAETRLKISEARKGKEAKAVICVETGILYGSGTEAAKSVGITQQTISAVLRGVLKTAGGYHWKYAENMEETK